MLILSLLRFSITTVYLNEEKKKNTFKILSPPYMSIKDEAHPNSLKTNGNKTVLILVSYYNNTNLNLEKKFIWKGALYQSVRKKWQLTIQNEIQFSVF